MATFIITGGAGFIGSHAVHHFYTSGHKVIVVDKLTYAADKNRIHPEVLLIEKDIVDLDWAATIDEHNPKAVINFAAESHVDKSLVAGAGLQFIQSNVLGVYQIVQGIQRAKHKADLIHISTDEVLGDFPLDMETLGFTELERLRPNNLYAATKASAECIIQAMQHTHRDFNYVICRATNNFGPNQDLEKFIPTVISSILQGKNVPIYAQGENIREWLWVGDFIRGIDAAVNMPNHVRIDWFNTIFHFGSGIRISNLALARMIIRLMGRGQIEFVADRPGHDQQYALYCNRAKNILKWKLEQKLEEGLKIVIEDIKKRLVP
jgi:dTDP-glucose 4,6-dehydratase